MNGIFRVVLAGLLLLSGSAVFAGDKPNIVYMLVDNWGWGDLSIQGSTIATPRIDSLAGQGMRFTNFNVQNQCTPTRSGLAHRPPADSFRHAEGRQRPANPMVWRRGSTRLPSCSPMLAMRRRSMGSGTSARSPGGYRTTRATIEWWGINEGSQAAAYTSTPQFDPTVADVPHIWTGVKGKASTKLEVYDIPAKASMDSRSTAKAIDYIQERSRRESRSSSMSASRTSTRPGVFTPTSGTSPARGSTRTPRWRSTTTSERLLDAIKAAGIARTTRS